ncbi:MAG: M48 family metalloprotease [Porticoccaceae bacterium]|nr:M48 family metalloprotease [Porticoccaceae bacterium]
MKRLLCFFIYGSQLLLIATLLSTPLPIHAEQALMMSAKKAAKIGQEMYDEVTAQTPVLVDKKITDYVNTVGQKIARHSDEPDRQYTFTVLDSPDINAFATPGGYVYINRGLLAYMNSESQLAAVLGHEVAHITADHASQQQLAQTGSNVIAGVLTILTGSVDVGEASAQWGAASVKGYGREMELEADALGNTFLNRAGYDSEAMIAIISQLKAHERYTKKRSADAGKKTQTYHGLFASHPRNDKRLRQMLKTSSIKGAKQGAEKITANIDTGNFRVATNGLVWGKNSAHKERKATRFYQDKLRFQFDYPKGWVFKDLGLTIKGENEKKSASLSVAIKARTLDSPRDYIKNSLDIAFIKKSESLIIQGLKAHTGIIAAKNGTPEQRLIVIYYGRRAYIFRGQVKDGKLNAKASAEAQQSYDRDFLAIASSFKPRSLRELQSQKARAIYYVKTKPGATYERLAQHLKLGRYGVDQLRLINGNYPSGEPTQGQWLKIIR